MTATAQSDDVHFCRPRHLPEVELVSASYRNRQFPEHYHEELVVGAIAAGAENLAIGRCLHVADQGSVLRLRPGEAHANASLGEDPLKYVVLYIPTAVLGQNLVDRKRDHIAFATPVVRCHRLYTVVTDAHAALSDPRAEKLEQESAMAVLLGEIGLKPAEGKTNAPQSALAKNARDFIEDHLAGNIGLADLCQLTGSSPFHLIRTFKKQFGLSPLAYRNQRRLAVARRRLADGQSTIEVALDLGFADQSHFTRHFQKIVGTSPGRYALSMSRLP